MSTQDAVMIYGLTTASSLGYNILKKIEQMLEHSVERRYSTSRITLQDGTKVKNAIALPSAYEGKLNLCELSSQFEGVCFFYKADKLRRAYLNGRQIQKK